MSTRYFLTCILCAGFLLALMPVTLLAQCENLVNGGFEDPTLGNYNDVVSPQFTPGFWGDENAFIVDSSEECQGVLPHSGSRMLEEWPSGGMVTEAWQVLQVVPNSVGNVSVSAWFNACDGNTPNAAFYVRTFNSATGYANPTSTSVVGTILDSSSSTWQQLSIGCEAIPSDTEWILINVQFNNASLNGMPGFVDDVEIVCDCPVANEPTSWGTLKAIYRN